MSKMNSYDAHQKSKPSVPILIHLTGLCSLIWLLIRSGAKPSRLTYPCQRAALTGFLSSLGYWTSLIGFSYVYCKLRNAIEKKFFSQRILYFPLWILLCAMITLAAGLYYSTTLINSPKQAVWANTTLVLPAWTNPDAISNVFLVKNVPPAPCSIDDGIIPAGVSAELALHDQGIDALVQEMAEQGLFLHQSSSTPTGIIAPDDVVVIKINKQWSGDEDNRYNHTNIDRLKGLIYRILQHPEGFTGAILIAENTQGVIPSFDAENYNNADDQKTSYLDTVKAFQNLGYPVAIANWDDLNDHIVQEYNKGDNQDGYVLEDDPEGEATNELSWPKFKTTVGSKTYSISMRYGLWDGSAYDNTHLKFINFPVIKAHGMAGATLSVKNYIGFLTLTDLESRFGSWDEMHGYFWGYQEMHSYYGLLGRQLARIRKADLNILDGTWINPNGNLYEADSCIRENILAAGIDPIALDYYVSVHCLTPIALYPELTSAAQRPEYYTGNEFRHFLMINENQMRQDGINTIINLDDSLSQQDEENQFNVFVADAQQTKIRDFKLY